MSNLDFNPPGTTNTICDISHHNQNVDFALVKSSGILGVLHKATQSIGANFYTDKTYPQRRIEAKAAGLLWGAYHFGTSGSGSDQADAFLNYTKPDNDTLLVLDFETVTTTGESNMSLQEARDFVSQIQLKTGKYPGIYGGALLKQVLESTANGDPVLSKCWLWLSEYGPVAKLPKGWDNYTLWQYTDGTIGSSTQPVNGIGQCDRDLFYGTENDLISFWQNDQV